jgi:hypothetical protein
MTSPIEQSDGSGADGQAPDVEAAASPVSPGDALRSLSAEAERRGTRLVSAHAMQARLFSVYDAAAAAEVALSLVQDQLTRTLDRRYYEPEEIEAMAAQLDILLALETMESETAEMAEGVGPPAE